MSSQSEAVNVNFGSCSQDIGFSTELSATFSSKNLNFNSIDGVNFVGGKVDNDSFKAIIRPAFKDNRLVL